MGRTSARSCSTPTPLEMERSYGAERPTRLVATSVPGLLVSRLDPLRTWSSPSSGRAFDRSGRILGHVTVDSAPTTAVTGTFWQAIQPVSGTVTANQGTAAAVASAWPVKNTDGTNVAAVKAASTAAVATDPCLVVGLS